MLIVSNLNEIPYNEYYRDCVVFDCTMSAHWESKCITCGNYACSGHIGYLSKQCTVCFIGISALLWKSKYYPKPRKKRDIKINYIKKTKKESKSELDEDFDKNFFKTANYKKIRRKNE